MTKNDLYREELAFIRQITAMMPEDEQAKVRDVSSQIRAVIDKNGMAGVLAGQVVLVEMAVAIADDPSL